MWDLSRDGGNGVSKLMCLALLGTLLSCIAVQQAPVSCATTDFSLKDVYWATPVFPENRTLVVALAYSGPVPASSVNATLDISPISNASAANASYSGTISKGDTIYLEFPFNLSSEAIAGNYMLHLEVDYLKDSSPCSFNAYVEADVKGNPDLGVSISPEPIRILRGSLNTVSLIVENKGDGLARNLRASVQSQDLYLTLMGGNQFDLGMIGPGDSKPVSLSFFAENGIGDGSSFSITLSYEGEDGTPYSRIISIGLKVEAPGWPRVGASSNTTELAAGAINWVELKVSNTGLSSALNVSVKVTPVSDRLTLLGANSFEAYELPPGGSSSFVLPLYLDPQVYGSLRLSVSVSYRDERNASYAETVTIGFKSAPSPAPLLVVSSNTSSLKPNSVNSIAFTVENAGSDSARNVTFSIFSQSPQIAVVVGTGSSTASEVAPNASLAFNRSVFVQPGAFGAVPLYVQVQYKDSLDNYYSYTSTFGFSIESNAEVAVSTVSTIPSPVFPGDRVVRLICIVVNNGNYTAENVRLRLGGAEGAISPSYAGTDRFVIPYLPVGGSAQVQFLVDISEEAQPGYYELPLIIATGSQNSTAPIPFTIREKAPVSVERMYFDREATPGARNLKLFVELRNTGNQTAEQVRLSIVSGYITGSTSTLVGSLPGNSSKIVLMEVDLDQKAQPGSIPIDVELTWTQEGRQLSATRYCDLPVSPPPGISPVALIAAAAVLGVVAFLLRRRIRAVILRN